MGVRDKLGPIVKLGVGSWPNLALTFCLSFPFAFLIL